MHLYVNACVYTCICHVILISVCTCTCTCISISILNALQERRADREKEASKGSLHQQQAESWEKKAWKTFWDEQSPGLLLYACGHGTVEIVKYFVTKLVPPTTRYI